MLILQKPSLLDLEQRSIHRDMLDEVADVDLQVTESIQLFFFFLKWSHKNLVTFVRLESSFST